MEQPDPHQVEEARSQLTHDWGLGEQTPTLLTLSRISPEKNQELLLEALKVGEEQEEIPPGLTLVIAGQAAYMRGQHYRDRLESIARELKLTRVIFPGHLGGAVKRAALEMATLFVVPSCHESYGLTTMEAMAAGLPVVGLASYGVATTVDEQCGVLLPPADGSPSALWAELRRLLQNPQRRASLAEGARQRARANSFATAADQLLALVTRLSS